MKNLFALALLAAFIHGMASGDPWWIFGSIAVMVLSPCSFDPAIRIKVWQIKQGWHPESRR